MTVYEEALALERETADPTAEDWRSSRAYRLWRIVVIKRDDKCVICGRRDSRHAHHVNHATYFVDQRFDPENGVTLCSGCHLNYHCQFNRSYRTKCDEYNFMNFVDLAQYFNDAWRPDAVTVSGIFADGYEAVDGLRKMADNARNTATAYFREPRSVMGYVGELARLRGLT